MGPEGKYGYMDNSLAAKDASGPAQTDAKKAKQEYYRALLDHCNKYKGAQTGRSVWQLVSTLAIFAALMAVEFFGYYNEIYWLTALAMIPAAGVIIRLFIIQHDCGHGSFFNQKWATTLVGHMMSVITFTPYDAWRRTHNVHHASSGNLGKRGSGAIDTLTVAEYNALTPFKRFAYRVYRSPWLLLVFGPPLHVLIFQRFPPGEPFPFIKDYNGIARNKQSWRSVMTLNALILATFGVAGYFLGYKAVAILHVSTLVLAFWGGQWLFFVQHQYEDVHWDQAKDWSFAEAAVQGSSFYALPRILQWFTGNIGFHHVHHLCSNIPNYRLEECHNASPELQKVKKLHLLESFKCATLALWDEEKSRMIRFKDLKSA